jgi:DNA-binding GntR family transcriptional regulator
MSKSAPSLTPFDANAPSLTERTIEAVREAIRTGALRPGELYSVYQLAAELGVSRSPVRDALLRLAETGMVRFERNRGFRVLVPGARELAEILAVRLALEVPAARRAARIAGIPDRARLHGEYRAMEEAASAGDETLFLMHDQRLHALILELAGNSYVARVIDNLRDATRLVGASTIEHSRTLHDVQREHLPIIEAVEANDPERAALAMAHHLTETGRLLVREAALRDGASVDVDGLWDDLVN